jgi:all-trans-retinol 13,14-reductase
MKYDVIVVGGGLGGLTAGAKLAREGKKVLLIEQHTQPGGCATTFKRGDYTLEVGLHEMDGPSPRDMKNRISANLG